MFAFLEESCSVSPDLDLDGVKAHCEIFDFRVRGNGKQEKVVWF